MAGLLKTYDRLTAATGSRAVESLMLLFVRVAFAGIFWRSARTKVDEGSWLSISDTTYVLFQEEYAGLPLPTDLSVPLATYAEHLFPILLVLGLFTRFSAIALLVMTMVIQIFVYPDVWWSVHMIWVALALVLIVRGGGALSLDAALLKARGK